uniref:Uncharacterized protein n=1 Tax=Lactococcus lactis subsp. cremoris TaxID=1359 RepID=K7DWD1_LACLC|nr:hypothetical protein pLP712_38 [Lactococcus cremoris]
MTIKVGHQFACEGHLLVEFGHVRSKRDALVIKVFADIARISHVAEVVFVVATARFQDGIQILIENRWIVVQRLIKGRGKLVAGCLTSELFVDLDLGKALIQFQNDHSSSFHF